MNKIHNYDVVVIGAGPGGHRVGELLAQAGNKVLIIERDRAGGNCVQNACMPTKAMLALVKDQIIIKRSQAFGFEGINNPKIS
jgi:dihydrolipoamide dehydrogenase